MFYERENASDFFFLKKTSVLTLEPRPAILVIICPVSGASVLPLGEVMVS